MPSFGETLKRERELRQISLREIAEATKINLRYLEALERNDFRHLPGGVFNKGFVRAYAAFIGVDPETMATAYLEEEQQQEQERAQRAEPAEPRASAAATADIPRASRVWVVIVIIILVLLLVGAGLTALGYGPLASRFKSIRSAVGIAAGDSRGVAS